MPIARGAPKDVPMSVSPLPRAPIVAPSPPPRFVTGSIARHILVMTGTGAVGLMAIFVSDFATLFFLGLLGDLQLLAAVGYAGAIIPECMKLGLVLAYTLNRQRVMRLEPPLVVTEIEIDEAMAILEQGVTKAKEKLGDLSHRS